MRTPTPRVTLTVILIIAGLLLVGFELWRRQSGAENLLTMQGVQVCKTSRDFSTNKKECPRETRLVTNCDEARAAIQKLSDIELLSETSDFIDKGTNLDCQLKTVNRDEQLYALVVHAAYETSSSSPSPLLQSDPTRSNALQDLYRTYDNLYHSYLNLDLTDQPNPSPSLENDSALRPFTPAFLVKGDPGFLLEVTLEDENGTVAPGANTHIEVRCGSSSDTMVAEPNGTSWFSFAGYEKLQCGEKPLTASVIVQRDGAGRWIIDTPSYSYSYQPDQPTTLAVQNRPQPVQLVFQGKWQGIGAQARVSSLEPNGTVSQQALAGATVEFECSEQSATPYTVSSIGRTTNNEGRASVSLADILRTLPGCVNDAYTATLKGGEGTPAYDFYFPNPGPVLAGNISGRQLSGGIIQGQELQLGGTVYLQDVGDIVGGAFGGNTVCLFYSNEAAAQAPGCPAERTPLSQTTHAAENGNYLFGGGSSRISYGDYIKNGSSPLTIRVVNYKNEAYPAETVESNNTPVNPRENNQRDIRLPVSEKDLKDHVCLRTIRTFGSESQCEPLFTIIFRESRWNVSATNPSSGACGLFQSNPCEKYQQTAQNGEPYKAISNQIRWGIQYVKNRYGTPSGAWSFWQENNYY